MHTTTDLERYLVSYNSRNKSSALFQAALLDLDVQYMQGQTVKTNGALIQLLEPVHGDSLSLLNSIDYESKLETGDKIVVPDYLLFKTVDSFNKEKKDIKKNQKQKKEDQRKIDTLELKAQRLHIPVKRESNKLELDCSLEELLEIVDNQKTN